MNNKCKRKLKAYILMKCVVLFHVQISLNIFCDYGDELGKNKIKWSRSILGLWGKHTI
jgi:hypothetical protein